MKLSDLPVYWQQHERITQRFLPWWYGWVRAQLSDEGPAVPCEGCGAQCCQRNDVVLIPPFDDPAHFATVPGEDGLHLQRRPDGACIHLTADDRCGVYDHRPFLCRTFDCRVYPASLTVVLVEGTEDTLTMSSAAGLTRFEIVACTPAERTAVAAVAQLRAEAMADGLTAEAAIGAALLLWPRLTGGPALSFIQQLERRSGADLIAAIGPVADARRHLAKKAG